MAKTVLQTKNLIKTYTLGNTTINAVNDVSIQINEGELVAIIGKSDSGKSTLMHLIGLLDTPTSGEISLNNKQTHNLNDKQLAKIRNQEIGFVFQAFNLLPRTTALENVMLPLKYSNVPKNQWKQKATEMLKIVELQDRMQNKSNELSGGQKQRVAIARALVTNPSIILADEPTGNLDSKTSDEIVNLFINLNKSGKTIVLVTHDDDLAKIAQKTITLKDGKVVDKL